MAAKIGRRQAGRIWRELKADGVEERFDPESVETLPEPARRYLRHAIAPGTVLARWVELRMEGGIALDPAAPPLPMRAEQLLAVPRGLVWKAQVASGMRRTTGFDLWANGHGAMRWWLWGLLPVVNAEGPGIDRSAAGRVAGESIWLPSALLPQRGASWEPVDERSARAVLTVGAERLELTLTVAPDGRLERIELPRWRTSAEAGEGGLVPFGADRIEEERTFGGYTIPTRLRGGWRLGAEDEEAFFFPVVTEARFG